MVKRLPLRNSVLCLATILIFFLGLERHSRRSRCVSERTVDGSTGVDFSYRLLLRDPSRLEDLLAELRKLDGVSRVTGLKAEAESEV